MLGYSFNQLVQKGFIGDEDYTWWITSIKDLLIEHEVIMAKRLEPFSWFSCFGVLPIAPSYLLQGLDLEACLKLHRRENGRVLRLVLGHFN